MTNYKYTTHEDRVIANISYCTINSVMLHSITYKHFRV